MAVELKPLPPDEAIDYFSRKGFKPSFAWQDVWQGEHAKAFTVAKMMREDLLADVYEGVTRALAEGRTLQQFQAELEPLLRAKGWWGRATMEDPLTGALRDVQLGSHRRLRIIYETNMRTARAAGTWSQIQRTKKLLPYLRYSAVQDAKTRPEHAAWHGTVLPVDDDWWNTHYPPNGWNCRCAVTQMSERELKRRGLKVGSPETKTRRWRNPRSGEVIDVPEGIDPGFGYNVGQAYLDPLTPGPTGAPPATAPSIGGVPRAAPPLPAIRTARAGLLPENLTQADYESYFLSAFGAAPGKPSIFEDAVGARLVIGERLFTTPGGEAKFMRARRRLFLPLLAETIKAPDEIRLVWQEIPGTPPRIVPRRRYIARWALPGSGDDAAALAVFETGKNGWTGITVFPIREPGTEAARAAYVERMRTGALLYRRED